jgi:hypothetical protein
VKIASKGGLRLEAATSASRVQSALLDLLGRVWQGLSFDVGHHQARSAATICHAAVRNVQQTATLKGASNLYGLRVRCNVMPARVTLAKVKHVLL